MSASTVVLVFMWMEKETPDTCVDFIKITETFKAIPVNTTLTTCKKGRKICLNLQGQMLINKSIYDCYSFAFPLEPG